MGKLEGKVALVTGSGRGIGRAIVEKFASEGARIVVNDLDADPAHETVEALKKMGVEAVACVGNVTAPDFADRFVGTALKAFKGIDIIGPLPPELQDYVEFAAGLLTVSKEPATAKAMLGFMASPAAEPLIRKSGMEPMVR